MSRGGLTLIEVLAALLILGTLIAGALLAHNRLQRQWVRAEQRQTAVAALDRRLAAWHRAGRVPIDASGPLPRADGYRWRTEVIDSPKARRIGASRVRIEVFPPRRDGPSPQALLAVEVLTPRQPAPSQPANNAPSSRREMNG